jgi:hypothetical protein
MSFLRLPALASVFVLSLAFASGGCAATTDDGIDVSEGAKTSAPRPIKASSDARHEHLAGVFGIRAIEHDSLDLAILEIGGGDPALNGDMLKLSAFAGPSLQGGVFDLGLNINTLQTAKVVEPGKIRITGTFDKMGEDGEIENGLNFEAMVEFTADQNGIGPKVTVTRDGASTDFPMSTDEGNSFLGTIFQVNTKETKNGTILRLYETGMGDPAKNGNLLMLSILALPEAKTYDLGIDVNTVTDITPVGENLLRISGTEDAMNKRGNIFQRPYTFEIKYAVDAKGNPPDTIQKRRLR